MQIHWCCGRLTVINWKREELRMTSNTFFFFCQLHRNTLQVFVVNCLIVFNLTRANWCTWVAGWMLCILTACTFNSAYSVYSAKISPRFLSQLLSFSCKNVREAAATCRRRRSSSMLADPLESSSIATSFSCQWERHCGIITQQVCHVISCSDVPRPACRKWIMLQFKFMLTLFFFSFVFFNGMRLEFLHSFVRNCSARTCFSFLISKQEYFAITANLLW